VKYAFEEMNVCGTTVSVRYKEHIDEIDALIIPGGESSTISKILTKSGMFDAIVKRVEDNTLPIMGTCAGCVLLAKKIVEKKDNLESLNAMDIEVERNAFGRQKESFEKIIEIKGFSKSYHAVFIRAPVIKNVWGTCEILSEVDKKIVAARQKKFLAFSFHPELTDDIRMHKYFLEMFI
jgi:5'-phosphate synthase pdxT subunit